MRIASFSTHDAPVPRLGLVVADGLLPVADHLDDAPDDLVALMARWEECRPTLETLTAESAVLRLEDVVLHAPVRRPGKIMGIGLNYADHAAEAGIAPSDEQLWFCKAVTSIADPFGAIELPAVSETLDYEAELVFVIGKRVRHATREEARSAIFGYCIGNDVTVREWQFKSSQYNLGKSFDTHAPIGPWIVTADAIDPHELDIRCLVNGERRQASNTRNLIFDCYDQVAYLSRAMTLEPGDLFFTGTPGGVANAMKPPVWLKVGDRVRVEIDGLGAIENFVRAE